MPRIHSSIHAKPEVQRPGGRTPRSEVGICSCGASSWPPEIFSRPSLVTEVLAVPMHPHQPDISSLLEVSLTTGQGLVSRPEQENNAQLPVTPLAPAHLPGRWQEQARVEVTLSLGEPPGSCHSWESWDIMMDEQSDHPATLSLWLQTACCTPDDYTGVKPGSHTGSVRGPSCLVGWQY